MRHDISNQLLKVYRWWRRFAKSLQLRSTTRADDGSLDTSPAGKFPVPVAGQMTRPTSCALLQVAQSDIIRTVRTNCHMWEQDLCTPINGVGLPYIWKSNYEVFFNRFRQRWMNFFLFKQLWFLLNKHSKRLFYCILLRRKLIKLLILESNIS